MGAIMLVSSIIVLIVTIIFESQIEGVLSAYGINFKTAVLFLIDRPLLIPSSVLASYFLWAFYMVISEHNWDDVEFSTWNPAMAHTKNGKYKTIKGGIKIINSKNDVLENCEVELLEYEVQYEKQNSNTKSSKEISAFFQDSEYPAGLYWWIDKSMYDGGIDIGRGKEAYLVLVLYDDKPGVVVLGEKDPEYMKYTLLTKKTPHIGLLDNDTLLYLRISAKVSGKPLLPKKIGLRIDITNDKPVQEVLEADN